mgnify:FL=1
MPCRDKYWLRGAVALIFRVLGGAELLGKGGAAGQVHSRLRALREADLAARSQGFLNRNVTPNFDFLSNFGGTLT